MNWKDKLRVPRGLAVIALTSLFALPVQAQTAVSIGTAKDPNLAAQLQIAQAKGYFSEEGLNVTISEFPSGGDMMAAFVGGSVDMATTGSTPLLILGSRPYPVAIVGQISDISGAQQLLVSKDVNNPEELYGKTVGMLKGTASEALFNSIVSGYDLDGSKIKTVNLGPTEMLTAFVRKQVDAVALWEPHTTRALAASKGEGKRLISGTQSYIPGKEGPRRVYGDHAVLFTSQDFAKNNQDTVEKVIAAIKKANNYLRDNREEAAALLAEAFALEPEQMDKIIDVNNYTLVIDKQMIDDMNTLGAFLTEQGKVAQGTDVADWINSDALKKIDPALVKID